MNHVLIIFCVFTQTVMSVKRKAPTRRVINLLQSPAKRVDVEEEQSQETQETSQRKFDTTAFYNVGGKVPDHLWVRQEIMVPYDDPRAVAQRKAAADELGTTKKPTGGPTLTHDKPSLIKDRGAKKQQTTGGSRVRKANPSPTKGHGSKKRQSQTTKSKGRGSKERQPQTTGGPTLRPGDLITAKYRTTNRDTSTGAADRTLLIISEGTTKDTPYYRPGLPVKTGFWCMHGSTRKFFVMERFLSLSSISVVDALKRKDSPLVLRATYDKDVQATQQALRKVNSALTYSSSNLGLHSQSVLHDMF